MGTQAGTSHSQNIDTTPLMYVVQIMLLAYLIVFVMIIARNIDILNQEGPSRT